MTLDISDRDAVVLGAALRYALANVDDVNDSFGAVDDDYESVEGKIDYAGEQHPQIAYAELEALIGKLGED